jgi:hypothetical protein
MQIVGDVLVGLFVVFVLYRVFLSFGVWAEKRSERIINETKKETERGQ